MTKLPSLTGKIFGKWTVGEALPKKEKTSSHPIYACVCVCGNTGKVDYYHLINKASTGCRGCSGKLGPTTCKKGHDLTLCGADTRGACKLCRIEQNLRRSYGMCIEDYVELYRFQAGKCAICKKPLNPNPAFNLSADEAGRRTEVDHKHVLKKIKPQPPKKSTVRGLLCGGRYAGCNAKLGRVDNEEWLRAAAEYLSKPPAHTVFRKVE